MTARALSLTLLLALVPGRATPEPTLPPGGLRARVVAVVDGDTLDAVLVDGDRVRVRLSGIDAPEGRQPYGAEATEAARALVEGLDVVLLPAGRKSWGRMVAEVLLPSGESLNLALVRLGAAWWWPQYAPDREDLQAAEAEARNARRGLWAADNPQRPNQYRKGTE